MNFLVLIEIAGFPRACHILCWYVNLSTKIRMPKCVGGIPWSKHAHAQSQFGVVKTDL